MKNNKIKRPKNNTKAKTINSPKIVIIGAYNENAPAEEAMLAAALIKFKKIFSQANVLILSDDPQHTAGAFNLPTSYSFLYCLRKNFLFKITKLFSIFNIIPKGINFFLKKLDTKRKVRYFYLPGRIRILLKGFHLYVNAKRISQNKKIIFLDGREKNYIQTIREADLVFQSGGGNIHSLGGVAEAFYSYVFTYMIAKIFNKPIVISAQTIGPFYSSWIDRKLAKYALNKVNFIALRDYNFSSQELKKLGVKEPVIRESPDDAFFLPQSVPLAEINSILIKERINEKKIQRPLIALSMQNYNDSYRLIPVLSSMCDRIINEIGANFVFVPMKRKGEDNDLLVLKELKNRIKNKNRIYLINNLYDATILRGIISKTDLAIGTRYHFLVFAISSGIPSIGIYLDRYYEMKIRGILEMTGQGDYALNKNDISVNVLIKIIKRALNNRKEIQKIIYSKTLSLKPDYLASVEYSAKILNDERNPKK